MINRFSFWWIGLITLVLGVSITGGYYLISNINNKSTDKWVQSGNSFKIQVLRETTFTFQYRFVFQTSLNNSNEWETVYTYTQDEPQPISEKNIQIIDESMGYFYFGSVYAVTKDKGLSWTFFDVDKNSDFAKIETVNIKNDGSGIITLVNKKRIKDIPVFYTKDYGQSWNESMQKQLE